LVAGPCACVVEINPPRIKLRNSNFFITYNLFES
jgi:hypothetical protein